MVSTTRNSSKVSYAERVLGAFSHLQRERRKHEIHVATLRAQIKRHAEAKKDRLGPHWTHWVYKAITKLQSEGILEHKVAGTVALTSNGKKAITDARRSLHITSPQKDKDDLIWKQITTPASRGVKRPRKSFTSNRDGINSDSEDDTASRAGNKSPRKRPRASVVGSSPKKSMSKLTKLELQNELASVKKAYAAAIRRPSSPLTELSDEENEKTAELKERLKERDQAIENMRRELSLMRNGISREENQAAGRSNIPSISFNLDQMSSPIEVPATMSRLRIGGVTRTQSGSYIPNLSKQPTPAPSSSERDDDYGQGRDNGAEDPDMAIDGNAETLPASLGDVQAPSVVTAMKSEIQDLQKCVAANLVIISGKETEISNLEKDMSECALTHNSIISNRDGTIASLREKISELQAEANALRESCRVAEETAARLTLQLQATEAVVTELRVEAYIFKTNLEVLGISNANLVRDQETMKLDLEQAKTACMKAENAAEDVQNHAKAISNELYSLKILKDDQVSTLADSLSRTSNDAEALREKSKMLEASVAGYEIQIRVKDVRLAEVNKKAADAELVNEKLKTELSLKDGAMQQYRDDLGSVQERLADAQLEVIKWTTKHASETVALSSTISDLQDTLTTANSDITRLTSQLQATEGERLSMQQDLRKKEGDLSDTLNILEMERKVKLAFEADVMSKNQELEEKLGYFKTSKETDEATISSLKASFMKLRESQLQILGEFEEEVISAQPSLMPRRSLLM